MERVYICIDLKSFYASVECRERNLDPLTTNLIVADESRTDKTICLAVTPSLKQYGLGGRARLFEVRKKINEINKLRKKNNNYDDFTGKSFNDNDLKNNKSLELSLIIAKPRMKLYIKYSSDIYNIYLKYVSKDDIFAYSIDEVFIDATNYLKFYKMTASELTTKIIRDVYDTTGITATAGIGTNLFLCKIAMDVVAKHKKANSFGVRIAELNEKTFRKEMWGHKPLTDIWRIGPGIARKLEKYNMYTLGDIARCSIKNEELLYKLFGVNAELIIDHAWGYEPVTLKDVKSYKPSTKSISTSQVLHEPYNNFDSLLVVKEMADNLAISLSEKNFVTKNITLTLIYDVSNLTNNLIAAKYTGEIKLDQYGRKIPKCSHGSITMPFYSCSSTIIMDYLIKLFKKISNPILLIRKIGISANDLQKESYFQNERSSYQLNLFSNLEEQAKDKYHLKEIESQDRKVQQTIVKIKNKYGKNAILKGINIEKKATARERNNEVGGHNG